jgi:hypothetical protein
MKRCRICNLEEGKFNVVLDENGTCNFCTFLDQNKSEITDYENRERLLVERFDKFRGKYQYDAVVGLSGGKDSTYVLCQMVKKYHLNVIAVTFDNGFLTDYARESIADTVAKLGVDHQYYKPNWENHRKLYKYTTEKMGSPCTACALAGYFLAIKACSENRIPFFVHGRTPFQMYRNLHEKSTDVFLMLSKLNLVEHSFEGLARVYRSVNDYAKQIVMNMAETEDEGKRVVDEFFIDSAKLTDEFTPEFLGYFLFEEYDEDKIKNYLEENLAWKRPSGDDLLGHYDCALHDAAGYLYQELNGLNRLEREIAVMYRFGAISRKRAEKLLESSEPLPDKLDRSMNALCDLCGISREDMEKTIAKLKQGGASWFESIR